MNWRRASLAALLLAGAAFALQAQDVVAPASAPLRARASVPEVTDLRARVIVVRREIAAARDVALDLANGAKAVDSIAIGPEQRAIVARLVDRLPSAAVFGRRAAERGREVLEVERWHEAARKKLERDDADLAWLRRRAVTAELLVALVELDRAESEFAASCATWRQRLDVERAMVAPPGVPTSGASGHCALAAFLGVLCGALLSWFGMRRRSVVPLPAGRFDEPVARPPAASAEMPADERPEIEDGLEFDPEWFVVEELGPIDTRLVVHVPFGVPSRRVGTLLCQAADAFASRDVTVPVQWTFASYLQHGLGFELRCSLQEQAAPADLVAELRAALDVAGMTSVAVERYL